MFRRKNRICGVNMNLECKRLTTIFLIALSLRLILFLAVGSWQHKVLRERILVSDAHGYHKIAVNLLENNAFSGSESSPYVPDVFRTPIYPFFLASLYAIFGYKPYIAILFQLIIGSIICLLIYKIGRTLFNKKIALLAGLFVAFEYSSILYSNMLWTETLFTFLFTIHIYFLVKFLMANSNRGLIYSAIFLGLSTLCRPVSIYFFIFLIGIFYFHFKKDLRRGILKYSILTLSFLLTIAPWMIRNYIVSGEFLVSSVQERVLHWSLPHLVKSKEVHTEQVEKVQSTDHNTSKTRNVAQEMSTKKNIINAVLSDARRYIRGTVRFFTTLGSSGYPLLLGLSHYQMRREDLDKGLWEAAKIVIQRKSMLECFFICFNASFLFFLYSTMCFGIYVAIRKNKFIEIILFISIIMYFAIAVGSVLPTERYRVPIMPYIILLSCYGIIQLHERFREYKN